MFWKLSLLLVTITIVTTSQLNDGISINHHRTIRAPDTVRQTRAIKPWGFFTKIGTIWNLINQVKFPFFLFIWKRNDFFFNYILIF